MATEERASPAAAPVDAKVSQHEDAAHQKRNWVRLTFDCNDHCVFCLDAHTHDGTNRDRAEVRAQILDGRRKGAERLILSGGEPTIHPSFVDFVRLGRLAGYERIQTVTNGRMFAYGDFLRRSVDAGLGEITFSIHGPNAKIHDALVGTKGAFDEEIRGLQNALDDGRVIINIDVCVNRANVRHLPEMLRRFIAMGVREYDLLHVIPFGAAYKEGRETLFYDLEEMRPYLLEAFAFSREPGIHIWLNRFPPPHLEGFEALIQDPYKLNDEVRGRKEEYGLLLDHGIPLDCRAPDRCRHCYLEPLCDDLDEVRADLAELRFSILRVDAGAEARLPAVYGGDPASRKRAEEREVDGLVPDGERRRLPILGRAPAAPPPARSLPELAASAGVERLWVVAADLAEAARIVDGFAKTPAFELELELDDYAGLAEAISDGALFGRRLRRVLCRAADDAARLLEIDGLEVALELSPANAPWILALRAAPPGLVLRLATHERLSESAAGDVDLRAFFSDLEIEPPVEGVPACVLGRLPRERPQVLDGAMLSPEGRLEIFRFARRYIADRFYTKSLRCRACLYNEGCRGLHINYVRAHGYQVMAPVEAGR
ncbi:MAG: radical SAM protein [Myxococcales bacterium]|nr:radical SAM protein [Myxococcales bacterium]